jgi:redox-sensing transcriptional repressor
MDGIDASMSKKDEAPGGDGAGGAKPSRASVGRLSLYLRRLENLLREGTTKVSSRLLGEALGVTDAQVRKDLAYLGNLGHPGIGYAAPELIAAIRRVLGIDRDWAAALVGVGNLARALLRYQGFVERGFRFVALFDADPSKVGEHIDGLEVYPLEAMPSIIAATGAELGVLTVPSAAAQTVAEALLAAGIRGVLNFTPQVLRLPPEVSIVSVDLTVQLEQLAFLVQLNGEES